MRLERWNGEQWWVDRRSVWRHAFDWVFWPGGWQTFRTGRWSLRQRLSPKMLAPVSFFGHRVTYYGWGWEIKVHGGYLVRAKRTGNVHDVYWSKDGTPTRATVRWLPQSKDADLKSPAPSPSEAQGTLV